MAIPVPAGTDAPCDFAEDWCATAAAINAKMVSYRQALARVYPAIPVALLRLTGGGGFVPSLTPIPFTEVTFDTAGMTDMDADPTAITARLGGRYVIRGWIRTVTSTILNEVITVRVASDPTPPTFEVNGVVLDRASVTLGNGAYQSVITVGAGAQIRLLQASSSSLNISSASMCMAWHSDTERP